MSFRFKAHHGIIAVTAELFGPQARSFLTLALDTGATTTMINVAALVRIGYDPSVASVRVQVTTGSGVAYVPQLAISRIKALGQECRNFDVLCHTLPPSATIDGLLGLDFFRDQKLTIDFRQGLISLA